MSDTKHSDSLITNERTLQRRAWIERALSGVRRCDDVGEEGLEPADNPPKPQLYVVGSTTRG